jgi:uncharacterized membrane protein
MTDAPTSLVWGAAGWLRLAVPVAVVMLALLAWGYRRSAASARVRLLAASLKIIGVAILLLCLLEPLFSSTRARPGANVFVVLADNSQSMTLRDRDQSQSRAQQLKQIASLPSRWLSRLGEDFDLRQYSFDTQLRAVSIDQLAYDGGASDLGASLDRILKRYQGRPLAGIMLMTDGNATDPDAIERVLAQSSAPGSATKLPPIYPVLVGGDAASNDINLERISVTQTNFEDAPVTLTAQITTSGFRGKSIVAQVIDENGKSLEKQNLKVDADGTPIVARFRLRPEHAGISFYRVAVSTDGSIPASDTPATNPSDTADRSGEATLANNSRLAVVDRGQGPYKVLYVAGRPNWEFKFLNRALADDNQIRTSALIRVAKREPKFNYLAKGEQSNPLFRGFDNKDPEQVENYDQPVIKAIVPDEHELVGGFPKTPEELYQYHAIILDDVESEFFTQDQMQLIKEFVRQRGGGLLMLGGEETFKNGKYDRTPIGDLLPVYVDQVQELPENVRFRMSLSREGWLEPWIRLRSEEPAEKQRLDAMPTFTTLNPVRGIKPGATILATADLETGGTVPALVEQRFGRGRAAALLIGDLWRWDMHKPANTESDLAKAWRQAIRWLIAEVPQRIEVAIEPARGGDDPDGALNVDVRVRDPQFKPLDNAGILVHVTGPDGKPIDLTAEASDKEAGLYHAVYVPRLPGAYRADAVVSAPDASDLGRVQTGWTTDPAAEEFHDLKPNRALLDRIAKVTGGQTVNSSDLESFVATLPTKHAEITEPYIRPVWHQAWVFLLAILCLCAEWGLRRWQGLP